jgi:hypothetical protein
MANVAENSHSERKKFSVTTLWEMFLRWLAAFTSATGVFERRLTSYVNYAIRDHQLDSMDTGVCLVLMPNPYQQVWELVKDHSFTEICIVDLNLSGQQSPREVLALYSQYFGSVSEPITFDAERSCYNIRFGRIRITHYVSKPDELKLACLPFLIIMQGAADGALNFHQAWVKQLTGGCLILSDTSYPLLPKDEEYKLMEATQCRSVIRYAANREHYNHHRLELQDVNNPYGVLRKYSTRS